MVYLAAPSQPADATESGEVQGPAAVLSSAPSSDRGAALGTTAVSRLVRLSRMVEISLSGSREGPRSGDRPGLLDSPLESAPRPFFAISNAVKILAAVSASFVRLG